jgi:hypothetical protein
VNDTSKEVYDITRAAAELIDKYIERHARSEEGARKRLKDKIKELVVAKPSEIAADQLEWNMKQFLNNIQKT